MIKIACDIRTRRLTGIYRYGVTLLEHLVRILPGTDIKLYLLYRPDTQKRAVEDLMRGLPGELVECIEITGDTGRVPHSQWIRDWVLREGIALYYSVDFVVDKDLPIPFMYTVHDIFLLKYPAYFYDSDEKFQTRFGLEEFRLVEQDLETIKAFLPAQISSPDVPVITRYIWALARYQARKSKHIIVSTESSKKEIVEYLSVPSTKVTVIPAAADAKNFHPRSDEQARPVMHKYGLTENYCLGVGLDLKHKRLPWLLEILAQRREHLPPDARVAIVGKYDNLDQWLEQVASLGLQRQVVFTGRVSDNELACLYSKARAFVLPSLDEGFGMPTVEALMCGTEVIVPDTRVLREVAGAYGHFYGVEDGIELGNLLTQAMNGSLPLKAQHFENRYDWDRSAQQFLSLLNALLGGE